VIGLWKWIFNDVLNIILGILCQLALLIEETRIHRETYVGISFLWSWSYGSWIYNYLCNQCLSPLMLWVRISIRERCTTLCDKVCQWLGISCPKSSAHACKFFISANDQWFKPVGRKKKAPPTVQVDDQMTTHGKIKVTTNIQSFIMHYFTTIYNLLISNHCGHINPTDRQVIYSNSNCRGLRSVSVVVISSVNSMRSGPLWFYMLVRSITTYAISAYHH
jgi:hypothetical protein